MTVNIQNYRSLTAGEVPPSLLPGQIAFNLADELTFIGNGSDVRTDIYGTPILPNPPAGQGYFTTSSRSGQGPIGPQGPQGIQGPPGVDGAQGPAGPQGGVGPGIEFQGSVPTEADLPQPSTQGYAYVVDVDNSFWIYDSSGNWVNGGPIEGPQGIQGIQGVQGEQGIQGPEGPQGIEGPAGGVGAQGPQGIQGVQGGVGPGIEFQGSVPTEADLPQPSTQGYSYLVEADDSFWIYDSSGNWVNGGAIQGPAGPQGPTGATGPQGPQGIQGIQGPTGPQGPAAVFPAAVVFKAEPTTSIAMPANTEVKFILPNASINPQGYYNTATGRFTPQVAGVYHIDVALAFQPNNLAVSGWAQIRVKKNGTQVLWTETPNISGVGWSFGNTSTQISMNGTTDYLEFFGFANNAGILTVVGDTARGSFFSGFLIR